MVAPLPLRLAQLLRLRIHFQQQHLRLSCGFLNRRKHWFSTDSAWVDEGSSSSAEKPTTTERRNKGPLLYKAFSDPDNLQWKQTEAEILQDIDSVICLTKEILHSNRYLNGQRLTDEDERIVVERLLSHHPHCEDKIGVGLDSIMVDQHPQFRGSRCLFVVRIDGVWVDFSYHKCLRQYVQNKYPLYAERFILKHLKRGS
ncbi:unnamed protein product [Cuscuta europaea]|uniref:DCL protein n=1 Tax=Cuscuta europaea TaxID=41803 RepID=A0A9P0YGS7_CUSEU|nr:unnamed protein product [Cuscuta europaea]